MTEPFFAALALLVTLTASPVRAQVVSGEIDLFELHPGNPDHLVVESTWTIGSGRAPLALKLDGGSDIRPAFDDLTAQVLIMPKLATGVNLGLGMRRDVRAGADLTHGVVGVEAELSSALSAEHYFFLSQHGDLTGGAKLQADLALLPGLTLQPRAELAWAARAIPRENLGSGITDATLSFRLRRNLGGGFDVYGGAVHETVLGATRDIARAQGHSLSVTRGVIGAGFAF
jgi:copper resistance protein B